MPDDGAPPIGVLVLMPTVRDAERTVALLSEAGVEARACAELAELCRELRAGADAILVTEDAIFADAPGQLAEALRDQPEWSAVPVLVLARASSIRPLQQRASESLGALTVVERPVHSHTLISVVLTALRVRRHQYQIRDAILVREQQAAELRAQEERLRFALSAGGLGAWDWDIQADRLVCSDICRANFGLDARRAFFSDDVLAAVHPDDRQRMRDAIERSVKTGAEYDIECRVVWPNGEEHWVMMRGRAMRDESGVPRRVAGVSLDVTELKRVNEALRVSQLELARQADALRSADRRKDEFLATLAHELRNPLAPIRTGVDLLSGAPAPELAERTLGVMRRQVAHMVRLIDDLLDVSRITRGKLELKRERVSLGAVINASIEASRPFIDRGKHTLNVNIQDESLCLYADTTRVAQIISNLLNNSSKYTAPGGVIDLSASRVGDSVRIEVRDNGVGIPEDQLGHVFEMFSQVNRVLARAQGGLGIGLALVQSLVEMHGGTVSAASAGVDRGSTFTVTLPLASELGAERSPEAAAAPLAGEEKARVLVVDDNQDAADLLALMLGRAGYATTTAYDGPSAVQSAKGSPPDVVILDIGLPGMSGYEVARELRQLTRSAPPMLVALTGWGTVDDKEKAAQAGFDMHLTKPVDADVLRAALLQIGDSKRKFNVQ